MADKRTSTDIMKDVTPEMILPHLPAYKGQEKLRAKHQETFDIVSSIQRLHKKTAPYYDNICINFWKGNVPDTAHYLYNWVLRHMPYTQEPTKTQTVKWPQAILEERYDFGSDCKHYASWIVGIGSALQRHGLPVKCFYRFASYNPRRRAPGHVFAVFADHGKEIWADPVPGIGGFNNRRMTPAFTEDKMPPMSSRRQGIGALYEISGLNRPPVATNRTVAGTIYAMPANHTVGSHHHHRHHWLDELSRYTPPGAPSPFALRNHRDMLPQIGKAKKHHKGLHLHLKIQPGKLLKKVGGAPSRNAYLLLLKLNAFHLATNIHKKITGNPAAEAQLKKFWEKLGGNFKKYLTAIHQGVNTYNKLHKTKKHINGMEEMAGMYYEDMAGMDDVGVVQVAAAAVIAAAAPIIAAFAGLLKSLGIHHDPVNAKAADDEVSKNHNDAAADGGKVNEDGSVDHGDGVTTKVTKNADGSHTVSYDVKDPITPGGADNQGDADHAPGKKNVSVKDDVGPGADPDNPPQEKGVSKIITDVTQFVSDHKTGVISTGAGIVLTIMGLSMKKKRGSMVKPLLTVAGIGTMGFGAYKMLAK